MRATAEGDMPLSRGHTVRATSEREVHVNSTEYVDDIVYDAFDMFYNA